MIKRPTSNRKALAVYIHESIALQAPTKNQVFSEISNYIRDRHEKLTQSVQRRELTESLEILSDYEFHGDLGIVAIRYIQDLGGQFDV